MKAKVIEKLNITAQGHMKVEVYSHYGAALLYADDDGSSMLVQSQDDMQAMLPDGWQDGDEIEILDDYREYFDKPEKGTVLAELAGLVGATVEEVTPPDERNARLDHINWLRLRGDARRYGRRYFLIVRQLEILTERRS